MIQIAQPLKPNPKPSFVEQLDGERYPGGCHSNVTRRWKMRLVKKDLELFLCPLLVL